MLGVAEERVLDGITKYTIPKVSVVRAIESLHNQKTINIGIDSFCDETYGKNVALAETYKMRSFELKKISSELDSRSILIDIIELLIHENGGIPLSQELSTKILSLIAGINHLHAHESDSYAIEKGINSEMVESLDNYYVILRNHLQIIEKEIAARTERLVAKNVMIKKYEFIANYQEHYLSKFIQIDSGDMSVSMKNIQNPLFDREFYIHNYPEIIEAKIEPYLHYLLFGAEEGRDPNAMFDTDWYLHRYPDVKMSKMNPLLHYLMFGSSEGRDPSAWFSTAQYLKKNPELIDGEIIPLLHYLQNIQKCRQDSVAPAISNT